MSDEAAQIADLLRSHPGTRDAAAFRDGGAYRIFVVPDDAYLDNVPGRQAASEVVLRKWQKTHDLSQLARGAESAPLGFNTLGWNSSYTRQPIPDEEMREWVERNVEDILSLAPNHVYEAGCGTGMLALRIAPHCERYIAADFAPAVLARFRAQLERFPALLEKVEVEERRADDFTGFESDSLDTFLLNSVVQYFPQISYLAKVIGAALKVVKPGGRIFIGDVRSLPLLPVFAGSVEEFHAAEECGMDELRARIRKRIERETELVISPAYFLSLHSALPAITRVDIAPLRGRAANEMTRFRYQAVLHAGTAEEAPMAVEFAEWSNDNWSLDGIRSFLRSHPGAVIGIKAIGNARIEKDVCALALLESSAAKYSAQELREEVRKMPAEGIDPQDLLDLQDEIHDCAIFLSWAACRRDGGYDAAFVPRSALREGRRPAIEWPQPKPAAYVRVATAPGQREARKELVEQLIAHCVESMPVTAEQIAMELVDAVPRSVEGVPDRRALFSATGDPPDRSTA